MYLSKVETIEKTNSQLNSLLDRLYKANDKEEAKHLADMYNGIVDRLQHYLHNDETEDTEEYQEVGRIVKDGKGVFYKSFDY